VLVIYLDGMTRLEKQVQWLERQHPDAAASLREGLEDMLTVNRSPSPMRRLSSTNVIENPHSCVRLRRRQICRWRGRIDGAALGRCHIPDHRGELSEDSKGTRDMWMPKAVLNSRTGENQANSSDR
jgi:hypothetical protein